MKKNGKKWRKLQKEKAERRAEALQNVCEPFSKVRKIVYTCCHYGLKAEGLENLGNNIWFYSLLKPISEKECQCTECGKIFPIESYRGMKRVLSHDSADIMEGFEAGYYRKNAEKEIELLDPADEQSVLGTYMPEEMRLCFHYKERRKGEYKHCRSLLRPFAENKYRCKVCGEIFSAEEYQKMESVIAILPPCKLVEVEPFDIYAFFPRVLFDWACDVFWSDEVSKVIEPVRYIKDYEKNEIIFRE